MKNAAVVLSSLSLVGVIALFVLHFSRPKDGAAASAGSGVTLSAPVPGIAGKIVYVNMDTLEAKYDLLKTKKEELKTRQDQMESELQRSYQQMQSDANEVQKKAQANSLTQTEYETAQKRLMQMQQSLETRRQSLTDQLLKEQEEFTKDIKKRLDAFLENYNKTRHYDYILSYAGSASALLYANKQLDITMDVVNGMNADAKTASGNKK